MGFHPFNRLALGVAARGGGMRMDNDFIVAHTVALDASQIVDHPFAHRAERVVSEGIHGGVLLSVRSAEAMFLGETVPTLPNGSRALFHFVTP